MAMTITENLSQSWFVAYSTEGAPWPIWSIPRSCCPCLLITAHTLIRSTVVPDLASSQFAQILWQLSHSLPTILWPQWPPPLSCSDNLNRFLLCLKLDSQWGCLTLMSLWVVRWVIGHVLLIIKPQRFQWGICLSSVSRIPSPHRSVTGSDVWQTPVPEGLSSDGNPQSWLPQRVHTLLLKPCYALCRLPHKTCPVWLQLFIKLLEDRDRVLVFLHG